MSLGAIDFGIIVDGAVVIVENCARKLTEMRQDMGRPLTQSERIDVIWEASQEVRKPMLFGELIIIIVYLPILTLTGVEGKMFTPMALTVLLALTGALILSFTFVPAAVASFLSGKIAHGENFITRSAKHIYRPSLQLALKYQDPGRGHGSGSRGRECRCSNTNGKGIYSDSRRRRYSHSHYACAGHQLIPGSRTAVDSRKDP